MHVSLSQIWVYPIKSLGGFEVNTWKIDKEGLLFDRQWMLVDANYQFITLREEHKLVDLCVLAFEPNATSMQVLNKQNGEQIVIPIEFTTNQFAQVQVWEDSVSAIVAEEGINSWFSAFLNREVKLVKKVPGTIRQVDLKFAAPGESTGFSDGFPVLLVGQSSLDLIRQKSGANLETVRFRPNLVVEGLSPHEEDKVINFEFADFQIQPVKPCARCQVTTLDPLTGEAGVEPLRTLSTYRKSGNKILFGMNCLVQGNGLINKGDSAFVSMP